MKRLLLMFPLLLSTTAIGPCRGLPIGNLDGGTDAARDSADASTDGGGRPDAGTGGRGPMTGGAGGGMSSGGAAGGASGGTAGGNGTAGRGTGGTQTGGGGGGGGGGVAGGGGSPSPQRLSCAPGTTWQSQVAFTLPMGQLGASFASDAAGGLYAAVTFEVSAGIGIITSHALAGGSWMPPAYPEEAGTENALVFSDPQFRLQVVHTPRSIWDRVRHFTLSTDGTWSRDPSMPVATIGTWAALADVNGNPQVLTSDTSGGTFLRSPGGVWTQTPVPAANRSSRATSIAMNAAGRTLLVYENGTQSRLESVLVGTDGTLGVAEAIAPIGAGANARALAADASTFVVVFSDSGGGLRMATKTGTAAWVVTTLGANPLACRTCAGLDGLGRVHALTSANGVLTYVHTDASGQAQSEAADFGAAGGGVIYGVEVDPTGTVNVLTERDEATTPPTGVFRHVSRCPAANAGVVAAPVPANAGHWQSLPSSATVPDGRHTGQAMAFDVGRHEMVMYGGRNDTNTGSVPWDTWTYAANGSGWIRRASYMGATNPLGRFGHGMAYDPVRARVVLMGGDSSTTTPNVWEWNGADATWTMRAVTGAPRELLKIGADQQIRLAYDSGRAKFVVLATGTCPNACWGLWDWDSATGAFTPRPSTGTAPVTLTSIAYDAPAGRIIGVGAGATWEWAPATGAWTAVASAPASGEIVPSGGRYLVYDGQRAWEWTRGAASWTQRAVSGPSIAVRTDPVVAFNPDRNAAWIFGGRTQVGGPFIVSPYPNASNPSSIAYFDTLEWHAPAAAP